MYRAIIELCLLAVNKFDQRQATRLAGILREIHKIIIFVVSRSHSQHYSAELVLGDQVLCAIVMDNTKLKIK